MLLLRFQLFVKFPSVSVLKTLQLMVLLNFLVLVKLNIAFANLLFSILLLLTKHLLFWLCFIIYWCIIYRVLTLQVWLVHLFIMVLHAWDLLHELFPYSWLLWNELLQATVIFLLTAAMWFELRLGIRDTLGAGSRLKRRSMHHTLLLCSKNLDLLRL